MNTIKAFEAINKVITDLAMSGDYIHSPSSISSKILNAVLISQLPKNEKTVFNILENTFLTTKEIALKTGLETKNVSNHLKQIDLKYPTLLKKEKLSNGNFSWKLSPNIL